MPIALPATPGVLSFRYVGPRPEQRADFLRLYIEDEGGPTELVWKKTARQARSAAWAPGPVRLADYGGQKIRIVFRADDGGPDSLVEVALDDIRVERPVGSARSTHRATRRDRVPGTASDSGVRGRNPPARCGRQPGGRSDAANRYRRTDV